MMRSQMPTSWMILARMSLACEKMTGESSARVSPLRLCSGVGSEMVIRRLLVPSGERPHFEPAFQPRFHEASLASELIGGCLGLLWRRLSLQRRQGGT